MRSLKQLLDGKPPLVSASPSDSVFVALELLAKFDIGALPVLDGGNLVGMFSERDYARKVILKGKASRDITVKDIMSDKVCYVTPDMTVEECMAVMTDRKVRHLPVLGAGDTVLGMLSIGDLVKETLSEHKFTIEQLERYITQ